MVFKCCPYGAALFLSAFDTIHVFMGHYYSYFNNITRMIAGYTCTSVLTDIGNECQEKMLPGKGLCAKIGQLLSEYRLEPVKEGAQDEWADVPFFSGYLSLILNGN